jgi:hypothetical protein
MTPEQAAVFDGHQKRLSYRMICLEGERHAYHVKSLGLTEIQFFPKRRKSDLRCPATRRHWILAGSNREFYSLAEVAKEILRRRNCEARFDQSAIGQTERCGQIEPAASVSSR